MARLSGHKKTLLILEAAGQEGLSLDKIIDLSIPRATFFRHRNKINAENDTLEVEAFVNNEGETAYRLVESRQVRLAQAVKTPDKRLIYSSKISKPKVEEVALSHKKRIQKKILSDDMPTMGMITSFGNDFSLDESYELEEEAFDHTIKEELSIPHFKEELWSESKWDSLRRAIDKGCAIHIKEYENLGWETDYSKEEFEIFPLEIISVGASYYLKSVAFSENNHDYIAYLNLAGIKRYSVNRRPYIIPELSQIDGGRYQNLFVAVRQEVGTRVKAEIWGKDQIDFELRDYRESVLGRRHHRFEDLIEHLKMQYSKYFESTPIHELKIVFQEFLESDYSANFEFIRFIPFSNELTVNAVRVYGSSVQVLNHEELRS